MTPLTLRLCTCGHRYNRHSELDKEIRRECLLCSCSYFEDAKSNIEEEPLTAADYAAHFPAELLEVEVQAPLEVDSMTPGMPDPCQPIGCDNGHHLPGCWYAASDDAPCVEPERYPRCGADQVCPAHSATGEGIGPDRPSALLESFNAWRCPKCGSRSPSRNRCDAHYGCKGHLMEPVRVEIHAREP